MLYSLFYWKAVATHNTHSPLNTLMPLPQRSPTALSPAVPHQSLSISLHSVLPHPSSYNSHIRLMHFVHIHNVCAQMYNQKPRHLQQWHHCDVTSEFSPEVGGWRLCAPNFSPLEASQILMPRVVVTQCCVILWCILGSLTSGFSLKEALMALYPHFFSCGGSPSPVACSSDVTMLHNIVVSLLDPPMTASCPPFLRWRLHEPWCLQL